MQRELTILPSIQFPSWLSHVCQLCHEFSILASGLKSLLFPFSFSSSLQSSLKLSFVISFFYASSPIALYSPFAPIGEVRLTSPLDYCNSWQLASLIPVSLYCPEHLNHDRKTNLPEAWLSSSYHIAVLNQIQTPLPCSKELHCVGSLSLHSLVLTTYLTLQVGWRPYIPQKCQAHAHLGNTSVTLLGNTAQGDLFPAGLSFPPSPFQRGEGRHGPVLAQQHPHLSSTSPSSALNGSLFIPSAKVFSP